MLEFFRSSAVRLALAFVVVTTVATTAVFGLVYLRIGEANEARNRLILEAEAAKSVDRSVDELRTAFELRLTHDLRRIDYAALFDANRNVMFGNIDQLPAIPVDGKSHFVAATRAPGSQERLEPAILWLASVPTAPSCCWAEACSRAWPSGASCRGRSRPGSRRCCCSRSGSAYSSPVAPRAASMPFTTSLLAS